MLVSVKTWSFARFPDSCFCFIPLLSSGIGTLVINKSLLVRCNLSLVQFHWFVKKERPVYSNQSCFVHAVLSDNLVSFSIQINILLPCLRLRQGEREKKTERAEPDGKKILEKVEGEVITNEKISEKGLSHDILNNIDKICLLRGRYWEKE